MTTHGRCGREASSRLLQALVLIALSDHLYAPDTQKILMACRCRLNTGTGALEPKRHRGSILDRR
jgi:hypothetical protein